MWTQLSPAEWPDSIPSKFHDIWQRDDGYLLGAKIAYGTTVWEVLDAQGAEITNQMDLPFTSPSLAAPLEWADTELRMRGTPHVRR